MEKISYLEAHERAALEMPADASYEAVHERALQLLLSHGVSTVHVLDEPLVPGPDEKVN